jgi:hypothetical protein
MHSPICPVSNGSATEYANKQFKVPQPFEFSGTVEKPVENITVALLTKRFFCDFYGLNWTLFRMRKKLKRIGLRGQFYTERLLKRAYSGIVLPNHEASGRSSFDPSSSLRDWDSRRRKSMSSQNALFPRGLLAGLSPLLISDLTDYQIAAELGIEELAVSEYISWILAILRLANRQELVFMLREYFQRDAA